MSKINPHQFVNELREQLSSEKRKLGFLFGSGTSISAGLPGVNELTKLIANNIPKKFRFMYNMIKNQIENSNIEYIINKIKIYKEIENDKEIINFKKSENDITLIDLEFEIYNAIFDLLRSENIKSLESHLIFSQWLRILHLNRNWPVEIFTPNYDLLFELAFEESEVPFFDGFVGGLNPFFLPEAVDAGINEMNIDDYPPKSWTRLWKFHGSINWRLKQNEKTGIKKVIRLSSEKYEEKSEMMLFPSFEKYDESRKLPFISLQDRLRNFLSSKECLFIIIGFSFSDQHINEILYQCLRSNPRLTIVSLIFGNFEKDSDNLILPESFIKIGKQYRNHTILGPDKAIVGGKVSEWDIEDVLPKENNNNTFWDNGKKRFLLGDFEYFCKFIENYIGFESTKSEFIEAKDEN